MDKVQLSKRQVHGLTAMLLLTLIALAFVLSPVGQGLTLAGQATPPMCSFNFSTGQPCPGCGLTRSWVALAHGDLTSSLSFHRLGWLVMLYTAAQCIRHALYAFYPNRIPQWRPRAKKLDYGLIVLAILLALNWALLIAGI